MQTKVINIDTRFRNNYNSSSSTDFTTNLPISLKNVKSMQLICIDLPLSYYNISEEIGNHSFLIQTKNPDKAAVIKIPSGRYATYNSYTNGKVLSTQDIERTINNALSENGIHTDITFTVDKATNRSIFAIKDSGTATSPESMTIFWNVNKDGVPVQDESLQLKLGWLLGFRNAVYHSTTLPTNISNVAVVSEGLCHLLCPRYLYLSINDYNNQSENFISVYNDSIQHKNILARLNVNEKTYANGVYSESYDTDEYKKRIYNSLIDINRLHIKITDEYGRDVNLNHMDWSMTLGLEILH